MIGFPLSKDAIHLIGFLFSPFTMVTVTFIKVDINISYCDLGLYQAFKAHALIHLTFLSEDATANFFPLGANEISLT